MGPEWLKQMAPHDTNAALAWLGHAVRVRGAAPIARLLGIHRHTLSAALAGTAREGTYLLIATRAEPYLGTAPCNLPIPSVLRRGAPR